MEMFLANILVIQKERFKVLTKYVLPMLFCFGFIVFS